MAPPVHSRYLLIDSLRGLASFWILCLHVLPFTGDASGFWPQLIEFGRIGTDFFFVTSGYLAAISCNKLLLKEQPTPWFTFSKSRFKRIFAIYWFSLIFAIVVVPVVCALLSYFKSGHLQMELFTLSATELLLYASLLQVFTAQSWQLNTAFSELNGVYWFIAVLLQIYLWLELSLRFRRYFHSILLLTFALSVLSLWGPVRDLFPYGVFIGKFCEFYLGFVLWGMLHHPRFQLNRAQVQPWLWGLLLLGCSTVIYLHVHGATSEPYRFLSATVMMLLLYLLRPLDGQLAGYSMFQLTRRLGQFSYSIYLNHVVFWPLAYMLASNLVPRTMEHAATGLMLGLILFFCFLFYIFFECPGGLLASFKALFQPVKSFKRAVQTMA